MGFNFEENKIIEEIKKRNIKRVMLQLPEGIKKEAPRLVRLIQEKTNAEVIVSGETCWGGCDVAIDEAKNVHAELLIHIGHAEFKTFNFPILYLEAHDDTDLTQLLQKSLATIKKYTTIGLATSIQHIQKIDECKQFYEKNNKKILIPKKQGLAYHDGHVIGCEYSGLKTIQKEVDAFVIIGNEFHSLGAGIALNKPVFLLDIYNNEILNMQELKEKILKQRAQAIHKVKEAKIIGIIQGLKPGQQFGTAKILQHDLEAQGKQVIMVTMGEVTNDKLVNFTTIEAFIELACPRIAIEDYAKLDKPIITCKEAQVVTGKLTWERLLEIGIV